jgi:nucleotide-binding universal stress UspA family protein
VYNRILLPTDGSEGINRAAAEAIALAAEVGAELHVLFVVEEIPHASEMMSGQLVAQIRQIGEDAIEDIRERADDAGIDLESHIEEGIPHQAILKYADDADIDLVVMGTHGRSGLDRYLLGSVTERVVRTADVPVLTVRVSDEDAA